MSRIEGVIYRARLAALRKHLNVVGSRSGDMTKKLNKLARDMESGTLFKRVERRVNASGIMSDIMRLRFLQGRRHVGHGRRWKALRRGRKGTIIRRKFPGAPILIQTGRLVNYASRVVRNTFSLTKMPIWESISIPLVYADYQNKMRPFMENPSIQELQPALAMARRFLDDEVNRIMRA